MTFDINKADIIDTTHVDNALASIRRNEENARRPATLLTWGKAVLLGGVGVAAVIAALAFLMHPKIIETAKVVEKPVIIEKPVIVEREVKPKPPVEAPLPPPRPAPVERKWDQLTDKKYEGIITDVTDLAVCYDHALPIATTRPWSDQTIRLYWTPRATRGLTKPGPTCRCRNGSVPALTLRLIPRTRTIWSAYGWPTTAR